MTEEQIKKVVLDAIEEEVTREGGVYDHAANAALSFVMGVIDLKFRTLRSELGFDGVPN